MNVSGNRETNLSYTHIWNTSPPELACVGQISLDTILQDARRATGILGGSAVYPAVYAAKAGARVGIVGLIGGDFPSEYRDALGALGINLEGITTTSGATDRIELRYSNETLVDLRISHGVGRHLSVHHIPSRYLGAKIFYFASVMQEFLAQAVTTLRRTTKLLVAFSPKEDFPSIRESSHMKRVYGQIDLVFFNEREILKSTNAQDIQHGAQTILSLGPKVVVVTLASRGSMIWTNTGVQMVPAHEIGAVLSHVGAGDAFAGAFLASFVHGKSLTSCGVIASRVAAEAIQNLGPSPSTPLSEEVRSLIRGETARETTDTPHAHDHIV